MEMSMPELSGTTYSEVDASNNQAAPNGMPEGMPPSGVNDSWRAAMGAVKRSYDRDHAGSWCTVGGTANAIALTFAAAPASYVQGEKYAFKATAANTGATSVNVNGLGAKNVFRKSPAGAATACTGGEIQNGDLVELEYDGTQFQILNVAAASFLGGTLTANTAMSGAAFNEANGTIAAAATTDLSTVQANYLAVTGTTTIAALGTLPAGAERTLEFAGALTLTHNATTLILPGGANIATAAGDTAIVRSEGAGNWRCISYQRGPASAATTLAGTDAIAFLTASGFAGNKSLAASGYYKFPGGLIVQWGSASVAGLSQSTITLPTAFPTSCDVVIATYMDTPTSASLPSAPPGVGTLTTTTFALANGGGGAHTLGWIAIGR
jgi:hypothetical protein